MTQSHFAGKRAKRKKERALKKALIKIERSMAQATATLLPAMKAMVDACDRSALAIAAAYKPLLDAYPRNWRHKKKLLNRKELTR